MKRTTTVLYKIPKNMGVAPRYDVWNEKYEPWAHMKRMGRLAGTGFYIPPEWYNHFRMFPPIQHNFQQERTLNPHNHSEPTQDFDGNLSAERVALRDELAHKSRLLASEGMRYYNIFWVRKPLDRMEKGYYDLKRSGVSHTAAIQKVLQDFYDELTAKKRVAAIQAEEAKLSGQYITMREATVVMQVLAQLQREQLTPHQASLLAQEQREKAHEGTSLAVTLKRAQPSSEDDVSADALAEGLADDSVDAASGQPPTYAAEVHEVPGDSVKKMQERATDGTGKADWYAGYSPFIEWGDEPSGSS